MKQCSFGRNPPSIDLDIRSDDKTGIALYYFLIDVAEHPRDLLLLPSLPDSLRLPD